MTVSSPVLLSKELVQLAVASSLSEIEAIESIYKMVYGTEWESIHRVEGWPKTNERTWKYICNLFIELTNRLNRQREKEWKRTMLPGGQWMNNGFERDNNLGDWYVVPAPYTKEEEHGVQKVDC